MKVRDKEFKVDIRYELEQFDWDNARWENDKLICSSPFRADSHASFFVRLESFMDYQEGIWSDSGGIDEWSSGTFPRLLSWLRGITMEEAEDYLLEVYGEIDVGYKANLTIRVPKLHLDVPYTTPNEEKLAKFVGNHSSYLLDRGISESVIKELGIGYDTENDAVTFVWRDGNGRPRNVKYRSVKSKIFWYENGCTPISQLIYNMDTVYKIRPKTIVITEAEIDAAHMQRIIPAVALGGSNFSEHKADILRKAPYKNIIIATDNDRIGEKMRSIITDKLSGHREIYHMNFPYQYKDVNDIRDIEELKEYVRKSKKVTKSFLFNFKK